MNRDNISIKLIKDKSYSIRLELIPDYKFLYIIESGYDVEPWLITIHYGNHNEYKIAYILSDLPDSKISKDIVNEMRNLLENQHD